MRSGGVEDSRSVGVEEWNSEWTGKTGLIGDGKIEDRVKTDEKPCLAEPADPADPAKKVDDEPAMSFDYANDFAVKNPRRKLRDRRRRRLLRRSRRRRHRRCPRKIAYLT